MTTPTQRPASHSEGRKRAVERLDSHEHAWSRRQNVTTKGTAMPPCEVCGCGAARQVDEPTPVEPDADEREALIDVLVMTPMADHIGTDLAPVERTADAILAAGYSRTPDAHLAAARFLPTLLAECEAEALAEAADAWDSRDEGHLAELRALAAEHYSPGGPSMPAIWLRARAARLREQGGE